MKFSQRYRVGEIPPYSDYRHLICYVKVREFRCVKCKELTNWITTATMKAVCSDECLFELVEEAAIDMNRHWLLDKD